MSMRPGDNAKLAPEQEQALLNQLREQREAKANLKLQADAQNLAMAMGELALSDLPPKAKELAQEKKFGGAAVPATVAILLHTILRNGVPLAEDTAGDKTPRGGSKKGGGGGGKKGGSSVKPTKIVDRAPCTAAEARKAIRANKQLLKDAVKTPAAQTALLKSIEWWLLSVHGSVALPAAAKVIEVVYDLDLASDEVLQAFWADVQSTVGRETAAMQQDEATVAARRESEAVAAAEVRVYDAQEKDAARHKKQSEDYAQYTRCGNNPNQEEQALEKQAIAQLKKAIEQHNQSQKVLAARQKTLVAEKAALEEEERSLAERKAEVERRTPFVTHAKPFFDWLAASDDESDDDAKPKEIS